jgi:hypothetical protein
MPDILDGSMDREKADKKNKKYILKALKSQRNDKPIRKLNR